MRALLLASLAGLLAQPASADPISILFVGNSFTFGRADPVLNYNAANVADLTIGQPGGNADEPHPWGGIPGIFQRFTAESGLSYDVSISARNAATLRGHYLNTNPDNYDLRGRIGGQRWDAVVLQENSTEPLPVSKGGNPANFQAYSAKLERWIHDGAADRDGNRQIPANANANPDADIYLYQTWARPDLIYPNGARYGSLEAMQADLGAAYRAAFDADGRFASIAPVGDAFLGAVTSGAATRNPYAPDGLTNLWYRENDRTTGELEFFHPSIYGSYLSALTLFGTVTGLDPASLGPDEIAARELGIDRETAVRLQRVASSTLAATPVPEPASLLVMAPALALLFRPRRS